MTNGKYLFVFDFIVLCAAKSRIEVISMVRAAAWSRRAAVIQAREWICGLSAGRLPVYGQLVAEKQAKEEVQP